VTPIVFTADAVVTPKTVPEMVAPETAPDAETPRASARPKSA
jgi:hypothetical protein